ncbi:MAG: histone [Candidatus Nanohaloarchaea archaeon]
MQDLIKSQGDKRVSENAAQELGQILERFGGDLAEEAIALAEENGRQTVRNQYIKNALRD